VERAIINDLLDQMHRDSASYFVAEGLPGRAEVLALLATTDDVAWSGLTPMQCFFLFETAPGYTDTAPPALVRDAYCAAVGTLPGDWWGPYGRANSDTSQRLLAVDGIEACLLRQLDNTDRLAMGESESATFAALDELEVGDVAAWLLVARHGLEYAMHRPPGERRASRVRLRQRIEGRA
jgi:hypothetical protein